jgi:hypothetical protein
MGNSCSIFVFLFCFWVSWFLCLSYGVDFCFAFYKLYVGTKKFYSISLLFQFMCYFASAGMLLGKQLNSPLLTIDSAARFFYCKVSVSKHLFSNRLWWFCWLVWSSKKIKGSIRKLEYNVFDFKIVYETLNKLVGNFCPLLNHMPIFCFNYKLSKIPK